MVQIFFKMENCADLRIIGNYYQTISHYETHRYTKNARKDLSFCISDGLASRHNPYRGPMFRACL
jgi:hypothetical protein